MASMISAVHMRCLLLALGTLVLASPIARAETATPTAQVREAAMSFLTERISSAFPGTQATAEIGAIDDRLDLSSCRTPSFSVVQGSRLWANGNLGVQCEGASALSFYLAYRAHVQGPALVARRPLPANYAPLPQDLLVGHVEYINDPRRYPQDAEKLRGARLLMPLAKGAPLVVDILRTPALIRAGQRVRIIADGPGFQVTQEGIAQQQAGVGDLLRLKLSNGHYVQGVVREDGAAYIQP